MVVNQLVRRVLNYYPFMTPRASLLNILPPTPQAYGPFEIFDGLKIVAYPDASEDHVVKSLFWLGSFDPWVCRTLEKLAFPGATALDIGANIGLMSLLMSRAVGDEGRVFSFEPAPDTHDRLQSNIAANACNNVAVQKLALSDAEGEATLVVPGDQNGMARLGSASEGSVSFTVPLTTFDAWAAEQSIDHVHVCKIDVEGHELQALHGMTRFLAEGKLDCIVFEDHAGPTESLPQSFLRDQGFRILRMHKRLTSVCYAEPGNHPGGTPTADYVAVIPGTEAEATLSAEIK